MALFETPKISRELATRLQRLDRLRGRLGDATSTAAPWLGRLRRQLRASTMNSSVSIEGFEVPAAEQASIVDGTAVPEPADADRMALACYARAMDHVGILAMDARFHWSDRVILDLHFDACYFQRDKSPGLVRTGPIYVTGDNGNSPAYTGPDPADANSLLNELIKWLRRDDPETHIVVRAAMAHLHLVSIHPFQDGNGRISRILQSLVLARDGLLSPEFNSIEDHLAANTTAYYRVLTKVQGGSYQPDRDAGPWLRFCVDAHIEQAQRRLDQLEAASRRWNALAALIASREWPDRLVIALEQALFDGVDRSSYAAEAGVSAATATADLRRLADAGWLMQHGRARSTHYRATSALREFSAP